MKNYGRNPCSHHKSFSASVCCHQHACHGVESTVAQILDPLKNARLVILALIANFILVPILAFAILQVISLEEGLATMLILMATAAGAPFLPKLGQAAKGNLPYSVGLMVLLMAIAGELGRRAEGAAGTSSV